MGTRMTDVGIAALAVAAAALVLAAFQVNDPSPGAAAPLTATSKTAKTAAPASLSKVRAVFRSDRDIVVSVLGDSTGNDPGEWVDQIAQTLGADHRVTYRGWNDSINDFLAPREYGDTGPRVAVWNFSSPGRTADFAVDKLDTAQPDRPDLVILNYGHNNNVGNIEAQMNAIRDAVTEKWQPNPLTLAILQNPEVGNREPGQWMVRETIRGWAATHGVPVVDVAKAFTDRGDFSPLMMDGIHPNDAGTEVWAGTVEHALQLD